LHVNGKRNGVIVEPEAQAILAVDTPQGRRRHFELSAAHAAEAAAHVGLRCRLPSPSAAAPAMIGAASTVLLGVAVTFSFASCC
jgi:hypothetical protein